MQYYVISTDGQKYGPADIATLNQWASEGRLTPHSELEDATSGMRLGAASVPGLVFPGAGPAQPQQPYQQPQQPYQQPQQPQQPYQQPQQPQQPYQQPQQPYQQSPYQQPPGSNYPRPMASGDDGSSQVTTAWICGGVGLCCCWIASIVGIVMASQAKQKGHPNAQAAMIFNIVALALSLAWSAFWWLGGGGAFFRGF